MVKPKGNQSNKESINNVVLLVGFLCSVLFVYSVLVVAQNLKQADILGAPNSYAAILGIALALYGFFKTTDAKQRYVAVSIIVTIFVSSAFWFYGLTDAGSGLTDKQHQPPKSCGCVNPELYNM